RQHQYLARLQRHEVVIDLHRAIGAEGPTEMAAPAAKVYPVQLGKRLYPPWPDQADASVTDVKNMRRATLHHHHAESADQRRAFAVLPFLAGPLARILGMHPAVRGGDHALGRGPYRPGR